MRTVNKIINVSLTGGLIGLLGSSPNHVLANSINTANRQGWNVKQVISASSGSMIYSIVRFIVLILTLFLYTFEPGYYIILEKKIDSNEVLAEKKNIKSSNKICPACQSEIISGLSFCTNCGTKL